MVITNTTTHESVILRKRVKRYAKIGGVTMGVGGAIMMFFPMMVCGITDWVMVLSEGSLLAQGWEKPPMGIDIQFYIFNIDNPKEFVRGAKARLSERGPYTYKASVWREEVTWDKTAHTVRYYNRFGFEFNPDMTTGSLDDKVTIVNLVVYSMVGVVRSIVRRIPFLSGLVEPVAMGSLNVVSAAFNLGGLIQVLTVRELFEGYPFLTAINMDRIYEIVSKPLKWFGLELPPNYLPGNKLGLLRAAMQHRDGPHVCETGEGDSTFIKFVSFKGKTSYNMYDNPKCNVVNASDGRHVGPFKMTKESAIWVPIGDLSRNFNIAYKESRSVWGLPVWRYTFPAAMFASPDKNPLNMCFCQTPDDPDMCDGIYDVGPSIYNLGAPIAVSYPHFLFASDKIRTSVDGMHPDPDLHETVIDFEPTTGAPLRIRAGVQVNLLLESSAYVIGFGNIRKAVLPFVWVKVEDPMSEFLRLLATLGLWPVLAINYGCVALFLGGLGGLGYTSVYAFNRRRKLRSPPPHEEAITTSVTNMNGTDVKNMPIYGLHDNPPPVYTISQRDYGHIERVKRCHYGTQTTPSLNGRTPDRISSNPRIAVSPPGTLDHAG